MTDEATRATGEEGGATEAASVIHRVAVVGASGYSGAELVRLLLQHPNVDLACVTSRANAGSSLSDVFPRIRGVGVADSLQFSEPDVSAMSANGIEVAFLALPHGLATEFALPLLEAGIRVVDLSADFRLDDPAVYEEFYDGAHPAPELLQEAVYGSPEIHEALLPGARLIAAPGCYPTSILLPLVPLLAADLLDPSTIQCFSMSGVSGAGRSASIPMLFAECNESVRAYSVPKHRHLSEIEQELSRAARQPVVITFTPHLIPVTSGIATTTTVSILPGAEAKIDQVLDAAYGSRPFVRLLGRGSPADTKNVVGTNFIDIGWAFDPRTDRLLLMSSEDNLGKGASSQAIQAFNIAVGLPEATGIQRV